MVDGSTFLADGPSIIRIKMPMSLQSFCNQLFRIHPIGNTAPVQQDIGRTPAPRLLLVSGPWEQGTDEIRAVAKSKIGHIHAQPSHR